MSIREQHDAIFAYRWIPRIFELLFRTDSALSPAERPPRDLPKSNAAALPALAIEVWAGRTVAGSLTNADAHLFSFVS